MSAETESSAVATIPNGSPEEEEGEAIDKPSKTIPPAADADINEEKHDAAEVPVGLGIDMEFGGIIGNRVDWRLHSGC